MTNDLLTIELIVANHPGVMSHITGLFSRRCFNLEGILCGRTSDSEKSVIFLLVNDGEQLEQIVHQLEKLYDVESLIIHKKFNEEAFTKIRDYLGIE
ncbi:MAG TPA: ACT domain-containing protein [Chitinispirillaceae bacterium]|nr:ACT domain-containing protein [Chitinispirillaceae bacterium]